MAECGNCGFTVDTIKGADGDSPYIGENGNWWVGDTDNGQPADCCQPVTEYNGGEVGSDIVMYAKTTEGVVSTLTYGSQYQITGLRYRVQPESNDLLRIECTFTLVGLVNLSNSRVYLADTLSSLSTHIGTEYSKEFSTPSVSPYIKPVSANTIDIDTAITPVGSVYTDINSYTGTTADRLMTIVDFGSLTDTTPSVDIGFTVYLPIEDL